MAQCRSILQPMESFRHYTENIEGAVLFTFYKLSTMEGKQYLVICSDIQSQYSLVYMQQEDGAWKITEPGKVSNWILQMEGQISYIINTNEPLA